ALAHLNEWIRQASAFSPRPGGGDRHLREMLSVLGLERLLAAPPRAPDAVRELAERRERARRERGFLTADRLREQIGALGWEVRDGPAGFDLLPLWSCTGETPSPRRCGGAAANASAGVGPRPGWRRGPFFAAPRRASRRGAPWPRRATGSCEG